MHDGAQIMGGATVAHQREDILRAVAIAENGGLSLRKACATVGVPPATVLRWRRDYAAEGLGGLAPRTANCGRKPSVTLTEEEELLVKQLYIKTESKTSALRLFATTEHCRPEVADVILKKRNSKHTITRTLRAQVELPMAVMDYHKSPTKVRHNAFINPRTLTYMDALGEEKQILPGDLFERDDMSNNFLCWVPWPQGGDKCSDRFGVRIARGQNLIQIDVASLFFISYNFLIRMRDSYRADDIWAWVQRSYQDSGMPRIGERWERGTWQSRKLRGDKEALMEAGHTGEAERLGGMSALGLKVIVSQSPTTKIIENRFNFFQTICATIPGQIGRSRGEMERINKLWTACREGHTDPRKHFLSYDEVCDQIEAKLHFVNSEPVEGTVYNGIPAALWAKAIAANPLKIVDPAKAYLFARDKANITLNKCHAHVRYTKPDGTRGSWWFYRPDLFDYQGTRCAVYYDKYDVASGATLVLAEGREIGKVLGHAELITNTLDSLSKRVKGFFLGFTDGISPVLLPLLQRLKKSMDFTGVGEKVGKVVAIYLQAFKTGDIGELLSLSLQIGAVKFLHMLSGGLVAAFSVVNTILGDKNVIGGLRDGLISAAQAMGAVLLDVFQDAFIHLQACVEDLIFKLPESLGGGNQELKNAARKADDEHGLANSFEEQAKDARDNGDTKLAEWNMQQSDAHWKKSQEWNKKAFELKNQKPLTVDERVQQKRDNGGPTLFGKNKEALKSSAAENANSSLAQLSQAQVSMAKLWEGIKTGIKAGQVIKVDPELQKRFDDLNSKISASIPAAVKTPEVKQPGAIEGAGETAVGKAPKIEGDRLAKIGGFIGAGGPALDYARRTAAAVEKMAAQKSNYDGPHKYLPGVVLAWT